MSMAKFFTQVSSSFLFFFSLKRIVKRKNLRRRRHASPTYDSQREREREREKERERERKKERKREREDECVKNGQGRAVVVAQMAE